MNRRPMIINTLCVIGGLSALFLLLWLLTGCVIHHYHHFPQPEWPEDTKPPPPVLMWEHIEAVPNWPEWARDTDANDDG